MKTKIENSYRLPKWHSILLVFSLLAVTSCQSFGPKNQQLADAEALIWTAPLQTLAKLDSIEIFSLSKDDNCYYHFILEHARYRAHLSLSPEILPALSDYFLAQGNTLYVGRVNYLLGTELEWLHKPYDALQPLKDAERFLEKCGCTDLYMGMTYYKLGRTYEQVFLYNIANTIYPLALPIFERYRHHFYLACTYRDLARTVQDTIEVNGKIKKEYYLNALHHAGMMSDSTLYYTIICDARDFLFDTLGIHAFQIARDMCLSYPLYAMQLFEHYFPENLDSAKYYLDIYATDTMRADYNRNQYYYLLSQYLYAIGQKDSAFHLLDQRYQAYQQDAIDHGHQRMYAIARQYDVAREQEEALRLKVQKQRNTLVLSFVLLAMAVALSLALWRLSKRKQQQLKQKQQMEWMRRELDIKQEALIRKLESQVTLSNRLNGLRMARRENSELYAATIDSFIRDNTFTAKSLEIVRKEFNACFPHVLDDIAGQHPDLTNNELSLIMLSAMQLSIQDICILLDISNRTLYNHRNRIKQHLGLHEEDDLDDWLRQQIKTPLQK